MPPAPRVPLFEKNDDPVVEVVERGGFDDFGFIVFRTDYFDEQRWEHWHKEFHRIIDDSMERASGEKKIEDKCFMPTYEDEDLAGATHNEILQSAHSILCSSLCSVLIIVIGHITDTKRLKVSSRDLKLVCVWLSIQMSWIL